MIIYKISLIFSSTDKKSNVLNLYTDQKIPAINTLFCYNRLITIFVIGLYCKVFIKNIDSEFIVLE